MRDSLSPLVILTNQSSIIWSFSFLRRSHHLQLRWPYWSHVLVSSKNPFTPSWLPSHLKHTSDFQVRHQQANLQTSSFDNNFSFRGFDVANLYTNIPRDSALTDLSSFLDEYADKICTCGLAKVCFLLLAETCLSFFSFIWSECC